MAGRRPLDLTGLPVAERSAAQEYDYILADLTFNSKIVINNLTMIAADNKDNAAVPIVYVITSRTGEAIGDQKLPLFYLLDSIVKNVGGVYVGLVAPKLPKLFLDAYPLCTPKTQGSMQRLLGTWTPVFGQELVNHISSKLSVMTSSMARISDQGVPPSEPQPTRRTVLNPAPPVQTAQSASITMQQQMNALFEEVHAQILAERRPSADHIETLNTLIRLQLQTTNNLSAKEREHLLSLRAQLSSWVDEGNIQPMCASFDKIRVAPHGPAVHALYDGLTWVSKADGMRFATVDAYRKHLDWLFKLNNRKRARQVGGRSRCWYKSESEWLQSQVDGQENQQSFEPRVSWEVKSNEPVNDRQSIRESSSAMVVNDDGDSCPVCREGFQTFWDDEFGAWMNKDAIREGDEGPIFHTQCFNLSTPSNQKSPASAETEQGNVAKRKPSETLEEPLAKRLELSSSS